MKELVKYEFKKIWTQLTIVSVVLLVIISTINVFIILFNSEAITSEGKEVNGLKSCRAIRNESKDIQGVMNQEYLDNLVKNFNSSKEKQKAGELLGAYSTKYNYTNQIINFANYGSKASNLNKGLDFDFIKSEKKFYNQYKKSVSDTIKEYNQRDNWFKYTDNHMNNINEKINKLKIPFKVDYNGGLSYFVWQYGTQYYLVLIVIGFALSSLFSKNSNNGIDELTLSSKFGRKKNMNARIIAGNIFSVVIYAIFIGTLLIEIGVGASLHGWSTSIQTIWFTCLYNISVGTGIVIMILQGLLGVLIVANLIMLISLKVKYSKLTTFISVFSIWVLLKLANTTNPLQLQLNPIYFAKHISFFKEFDICYFIGNIMIPYSLAFIAIAFIYMLVIRVLTIRQYKRYKLN
ncbi:membrane protein [Clostridium senegalense]|uniref:membrane protein n=1 Tax=Clostridium senegalense TaxID=1465809 RepID=UPI000287ECCA|nr:membrane protein [Clostridium senegalense]